MIAAGFQSDGRSQVHCVHRERRLTVEAGTSSSEILDALREDNRKYLKKIARKAALQLSRQDSMSSVSKRSASRAGLDENVRDKHSSKLPKL